MATHHPQAQSVAGRAARVSAMTAFAYTIVAILLVGGLALAAGIVGALWFAVSSARPELLERRRDED